MRGHKYRGQCKATKEWFYGSLITVKNKCFITADDEFDIALSSDFSPDCIEVIPETVGEFTGLHDKHTAEVYEGDIVVAANAVIQGIVVYQAPSFVIKRKLNSKSWSEFTLAASENQFQKVVGNMHENLSLLEELNAK